nr:uncharacterized protein CTRU02_03359 [Colletotrichum truncatum]KAF6797328.1 hypothetical protein CTRU02_03359 [Colletotrichum truncatum]
MRRINSKPIQKYLQHLFHQRQPVLGIIASGMFMYLLKKWKGMLLFRSESSMLEASESYPRNLAKY